MKSISEIKEKLNELKFLDRKFEIFGANEHQYKFNNSITIEQLNLFEKRYEVQLSEDYKASLIDLKLESPKINIHTFPIF